MLSIWGQFPAYVNLQLQIKHMNIPSRPTKPNELSAVLCLSAKASKSSKLAKKPAKKGKKTSEQTDDDDADDGMETSTDDDIGVDDDGDEDDIDAAQGDGDIDREERAKRCEDLVQRKKELSQLHADVTLILKSSSKFKKDTSRKDRNDPRTNLVDINGPWTCTSKLTGESVDNARFLGKHMHMFRFHTAEYSAISHSLYYRYMPTFASMILVEASAVVCYRVALILYQLDGGAAFLRWFFEQLSADCIHTTAQKALVLCRKCSLWE